MSKTSLILSVLMTVALVVLIAPGIFAMNRGKTLRNIALWLAIFTGLALIYQNFGPGSTHQLFSYRLGGVSTDKSGDEKPDGSQGFTPPRE